MMVSVVSSDRSRKKEEQINNTSNEKKDITTDTGDCRKVREYDEYYVNKCENLGKMDKFLKSHNQTL